MGLMNIFLKFIYIEIAILIKRFDIYIRFYVI